MELHCDNAKHRAFVGRCVGASLGDEAANIVLGCSQAALAPQRCAGSPIRYQATQLLNVGASDAIKQLCRTGFKSMHDISE